MRKHVLLPIIAVIFFITACSPRGNNHADSSEGSVIIDTKNRINYVYFSWPHYDTAQAIYDKSTDIFEGKVTAIFFDVINVKTGVATSNQPADSDEWLQLYTVYEVEVSTAYKGTEDSTMYINICGGIEGYQEATQRQVMKDAGVQNPDVIPIASGTEPLAPGKSYLFFTNDLGTYNYILNWHQAVVPIGETNSIIEDMNYDKLTCFLKSKQ